MTMHNLQDGLTMMELLVTIAIAAILLTVGLPSLSFFLQDQKIASEIQSIEAHLRLARYEAVSRNQVVSLEQLSGSWANGFIVFVDDDGDGGAYSSSDDELLKQRDGFANLTLDANANISRVSFLANGTLLNNTDVNFALCDNRGVSHGVLVSLSRVGRVSHTDATSCEI